MTGLHRTLFALAAAGLRWLASGEAYASAKLREAAAWCERRASPPPRNPGRRDEPPWPQGP